LGIEHLCAKRVAEQITRPLMNKTEIMEEQLEMRRLAADTGCPGSR